MLSFRELLLSTYCEPGILIDVVDGLVKNDCLILINVKLENNEIAIYLNIIVLVNKLGPLLTQNKF